MFFKTICDNLTFLINQPLELIKSRVIPTSPTRASFLLRAWATQNVSKKVTAESKVVPGDFKTIFKLFHFSH